MKGRRMFWTTVIGAVITMVLRRMNQRTPMLLFNGMRRNKSFARLLQPMLRQLVRRMAR